MGLSTWRSSKTSEPSSQQAAPTETWNPYTYIPEPILANLRGIRGLEDVNSRSTLEWGVPTYLPPPVPHKPCADPDPNVRPQTFDPQDKRAKPVWLEYFTVGSDTRLPALRKEQAENLVRSLHVWTPSDLSDLVVLFIGLAIPHFGKADLNALAMFAKAVNDCFDARQSAVNQFGEQFEKRVIGALVAAWDQACPLLCYPQVR